MRTITWTLSLAASVLILIVLALHMSFASVNYLLLVALVLYHGFYGLYTMLIEYLPGTRSGFVIGAACSVAGGGLFLLAAATEVVM